MNLNAWNIKERKYQPFSIPTATPWKSSTHLQVHRIFPSPTWIESSVLTWKSMMPSPSESFSRWSGMPLLLASWSRKSGMPSPSKSWLNWKEMKVRTLETVDSHLHGHPLKFIWFQGIHTEDKIVFVCCHHIFFCFHYLMFLSFEISSNFQVLLLQLFYYFWNVKLYYTSLPHW